MALRKAAVQSVRPSAFARRWKLRFGKRGGLIRESRDGKMVCHGSEDAVIKRGATAMAAAANVRFLKNSLRVVIEVCLLDKLARLNNLVNPV